MLNHLKFQENIDDIVSEHRWAVPISRGWRIFTKSASNSHCALDKSSVLRSNLLMDSSAITAKTGHLFWGSGPTHVKSATYCNVFTFVDWFICRLIHTFLFLSKLLSSPCTVMEILDQCFCSRQSLCFCHLCAAPEKGK